MLEALGNGVKGGKWFSLIDKVYRLSTLEKAWEKVRGNKGAAGVDKQSVKAFESKAEVYLKELSEALKEDRYTPSAVRRVDIPKGGGQSRPLGIPTVKDRIIQTAVLMVIEPIFEAKFLEMSYGFRPGRGAKDALREVDKLLKEGYTHVVDADLSSYFDTIPHGGLIDRVEESISDGRLLKVLRSWLEQDIMTESARWKPLGGTPQGAVISPLLANIYLHPLDELMMESGYKMVRYADDFVVMCRSHETAEKALSKISEWTRVNGLSLHPDKTHVGDCLVVGEGFEFLGYRFEAGRRYVRKKSLKKLRDRVRELTPRSSGQSLEATITSLNRTLKGWFEYFKHAQKSTFKRLDGFVRRRLRAMLLRRNKQHGMGLSYKCHKKWPNAYFAERGLFTMHEARLEAVQSR
jgi:RNA-directed DNA polymerase